MPASCSPRRLGLRDGRAVTVRAVDAADGAEVVQAFERLSADSRYNRFMQHKEQLDPVALERGVHLRAGRDFVLLATIPAPDGVDIVGAAQYVCANENNGKACEFAITVSEDWRGSGLGVELLASLLRQAPGDSYAMMEGSILAENAPMLVLARKLGFQIEPVSGDATVMRAWRALGLAAARWPTFRSGR